MLSNKNIIRLSLAFSILSWVGLLVVDLIILFSTNNLGDILLSEISALFLTVFLLSQFFYYKTRIGNAEHINFIDLLWRVFVTGLLATIVSFAIRFFYFLIEGNQLTENPYLISFSYHINLGLITALVVSTFIVWKRLILYQKSKNLLLFWRVFEYSLLLSLVFNFFNGSIFNGYLFGGVLVIILLMGVVLAVNLKWIAYLNFKQKLKSILLIVLILLYLSYFFINLSTYSNEYGSFIITNLINNIFVLALFGFILIYSVFSVLVLLFNLPTSSVFEQKFGDVANFQRLTQTIQPSESKEHIFEVLLDSSSSAILAEAGWIEIKENGQASPVIKTENITNADVIRIKESIGDSKIKNLLESEIYSLGNTAKFSANIQDEKYKSTLLIPLIIQNKQIGIMALLKDVKQGFNKESIDIIRSFANQACTSIENMNLLSEALKTERYKEELKIAQKVQKSLLPNKLQHNDQYEISGFSESADEVGGDYYDTFKVNEEKFVVIIGDVSGKGTSAAFNMSQMRGVFYALVQLDLSPKDFLVKANNALSKCLEKTSFITLSYFVIDTNQKKISFARAGHCPTLFYEKLKNKSKYIQNKGLGIGVLRNDTYENYVEVCELKYKKNDILMLYTDGITEARNKKNDEFGYKRLSTFLEKNAALGSNEIKNNLLTTLTDFVGKESHNDDYTAVILKFKK